MSKRIFSTISPDNPYTSNYIHGVTSNSVEIYHNSPDVQLKIFNKNSDDSRLKIRKDYLIRAYTKTTSERHIMHQSLVRSSDVKIITIESTDNFITKAGFVSKDFPHGISFDKIASFDRLTDMEVWY